MCYKNRSLHTHVSQHYATSNDDKFPCCVQETNGILTYNGSFSRLKRFIKTISSVHDANLREKKAGENSKMILLL